MPGPLPDLPSPGELVRRYGARAKRALGQNFLTDPRILDRLVDVAGVGPDDQVLEIGPGPGGLTRSLLARGCTVVAVELDEHAVAHLRDALGSDRLTVCLGDALKVDLAALIPDSAVAVGNLPYNAATEIFFRLDQIDAVSRMVLMFQREVAERFVARPSTKPYGPLAILSALRWRADIAVRLPPGAFVPRPRVHSAAVRFERLEAPAVEPGLEPLLRRLVRTAFQKRRKTLKNALAGLADPATLELAGIDPRDRPERIALTGWVTLTKVLERGL